MLSALRSRLRPAAAPLLRRDPTYLGFSRSVSSSASASASTPPATLLELSEVEEILDDVKAGDVTVIPVKGRCSWTDFMVVATGRSAWHVRNIAQALVHKVKEKQKGAQHLFLPLVEGYEGGKWVVINSGNVTVHALDEKARAYYKLESLWTTEKANKEPTEDIL